MPLSSQNEINTAVNNIDEKKILEETLITSQQEFLFNFMLEAIGPTQFPELFLKTSHLARGYIQQEIASQSISKSLKMEIVLFIEFCFQSPIRLNRLINTLQTMNPYKFGNTKDTFIELKLLADDKTQS